MSTPTVAAHFVWAALDDLGLSEAPPAAVPVVAEAPAAAPHQTVIHEDAPLPREMAERRAPRRSWMAWAAAAVLVAVAAAGGPAWYAHAQEVSGPVTTLPLPAPLPPTVPLYVAMPRVDPALLDPGPEKPAPAAPASPAGYTILVASFKSSARAQHVVDELTNAGFGARALERDFGPERGRFFVVVVSGYTSALDIQRDLHQIRSLPGGYADARIADRE